MTVAQLHSCTVALMLDVDGVLVSGRPKDGRAWASDLDADLGVSQVDLQKAFFVPYCSDIVTGRRGLAELLKAALATIAPDVSHHDLIDYWFTNDSGLDLAVIASLDLQRERGIKVYLATNQEHLRAGYLMNTLGLSEHCDGIYYSAAIGFQKPDRQFFQHVAVSSGIAANQLLLLDDLAGNVVAARDAGWQALQWKPDSSLENETQKIEALALKACSPSGEVAGHGNPA
jgi:putative hydrolase of the HAD superfamily